MSNLTLAVGRPVLADRIFSRRLATDLVLIAAGAGLTSIAAQLSIPLWPVPITGQTFAVLLVGTVLGSARGALSMALYLVLGLVGLPVFTNGGHGSLLALPSGGFIVGFIFAAALVGWLAQREWDHKVLRTVVSFAAGTVVMYAFGLPWLYAVLSGIPALAGADIMQATLTGGLYPFLIGDVLKALVAGAILPLTWKLVRSADAAAADRSEH
jgi:biotin transport system substrate-specific component